MAEYTTAAPTGVIGTQYLFTDHLGSTRMLTDARGTLLTRHDYVPFGEEIDPVVDGRDTVAGYGNADDLKQKFTGKEHDSETGLDYFGARYFSGPQGRFTGPDPLMASAHVSDPQSWNRYTYGNNNPLRYTDPFGLFPSPAYNCTETEKNCLNDEQRNRSARAVLTLRFLMCVHTAVMWTHCEGAGSGMYVRPRRSGRQFPPSGHSRAASRRCD